MSKNKSNRFIPFWMALCVVIGIFVGTFYANHFSGNRLNIINSSGNKLNNLLRIIDDQYVDTVIRPQSLPVPVGGGARTAGRSTAPGLSLRRRARGDEASSDLGQRLNCRGARCQR